MADGDLATTATEIPSHGIQVKEQFTQMHVEHAFAIAGNAVLTMLDPVRFPRLRELACLSENKAELIVECIRENLGHLDALEKELT